MRLLAITQSPDDASTRHRLGLHVPHLAAAGVEVRAVEWPRDEEPRRAVVASAADFDAVLVQRRLLPIRHALALRRTARRLAYDFDDAVILRDFAGWYPLPLLDKVVQFAALVSSCDAVTAGNGCLAGLAARFAPRRRIAVVPTVVDADRFAPPGEPREPPTVLGWIGQRSTLPYLQAIAGALSRLARRRPGLTLRCIADAAPGIPGLTVELRRWTLAGEPADLASLDVGLAPLADDPWTRGKCGLRLLQYLAAGVPALASAVGVQAEIASTGAAVSVRRPGDWASALHGLLTDGALRRRISTAGPALVRSRFTPAVWADAVRIAWCGG
jgi:glycosyltransferase involved in cell wall biosynthesis